jgi:hypothetical protein
MVQPVTAGTALVWSDLHAHMCNPSPPVVTHSRGVLDTIRCPPPAGIGT